MNWLEGSIAKIKASGARKVFVQVPEGLKVRLLDIGSALEKSGIEAVLSCEPCYGACDLRDAEAKRLGCELLLHIGHADMGLKTTLPVVYEEYPLEANPVRIPDDELSKLGTYTSVGMVTTIQYLGFMEKAKQFLESKGKNVLICKKPILGCDQSAAKSIEGRVDAFLFIGTGRFHAIGLAMATGKPVLFLDLEAGKITELKAEKDRQERIRFANVEKARDCQSFGVLVSTKPGQANLAAALPAKKKLLAKGRHAWILAMDAITPEKLLGLKLDCLVNCACPRLSEDAAQFKKPIIGPEDADKI